MAPILLIKHQRQVFVPFRARVGFYRQGCRASLTQSVIYILIWLCLITFFITCDLINNPTSLHFYKLLPGRNHDNKRTPSYYNTQSFINNAAYYLFTYLVYVINIFRLYLCHKNDDFSSRRITHQVPLDIDTSG